MNLGKNISEKRKAKGMTQEELAANLGVSPQAVSKWENNLSCPDIALLPEISKLFGISVDELLGIKSELQTKDIKDESAAAEADYEEPAPSGKKITKLIITRENNGKITTVKVPISIIRFGLNIGSIFGGLTGDQASSIETAIKNGLAGDIISVDGENGEKITISLA